MCSRVLLAATHQGNTSTVPGERRWCGYKDRCNTYVHVWVGLCAGICHLAEPGVVRLLWRRDGRHGCLVQLQFLALPPLLRLIDRICHVVIIGLVACLPLCVRQVPGSIPGGVVHVATQVLELVHAGRLLGLVA